MATSYQKLIDTIADGMAVNAANANQATKQLQGNIEYLKDILEAALTGSTVFARGKTINSSVLVGQAVFYNESTLQFEPAKAGAATDANGQLTTTASTHVWGIVYAKTAADTADILLAGVAELDMSNAISGTIGAGTHYLSTTTAGMLTPTRQAVDIPVCMVGSPGTEAGTHEVFVNTTFRDVLDAHKHYKHAMVCLAAADQSEEGWLAAGHAVFDGNAPAGAVYGYNISASDLATMWPPLPIDNAYVEWNKGEDVDRLGMGLPSGSSDNALIQFDENGIWWMSDCTGEEPYVSLGENVAIGGCDTVLRMAMTLWFTQPVFWSSNTAVLSLTPKAGSGLLVKCVDNGLAGTTGNLEIDLDLSLLVSDADVAGPQVVKQLTDGTLERGPVVEAIKAGSSNVTLASTLDVVEGRHFGDVTIAVDAELGGSELSLQTIHLEGATEEYHDGVVAIGFEPGVQSAFRGRLFIPAKNALPVGTTLKFRFQVLGRSTGTVASDVFDITYRRIPKPGSLNTPVALPTSDTALTLDSSATLTAVNEYYEIESDTFTVEAGDTVLFSITRVGDDAYGGDLHLLQKHGVIVEAP